MTIICEECGRSVETFDRKRKLCIGCHISRNKNAKMQQLKIRKKVRTEELEMLHWAVKKLVRKVNKKRDCLKKLREAMERLPSQIELAEKQVAEMRRHLTSLKTVEKAIRKSAVNFLSTYMECIVCGRWYGRGNFVCSDACREHAKKKKSVSAAPEGMTIETFMEGVSQWNQELLQETFKKP